MTDQESVNAIKPDQPKSNKKISPRQMAEIIIALLLIIAMVSFIVQNYNKIKIEFLLWEFRFRIVYLMLFSFVAGIVATTVFKRYRKQKRKK